MPTSIYCSSLLLLVGIEFTRQFWMRQSDSSSHIISPSSSASVTLHSFLSSTRCSTGTSEFKRTEMDVNIPASWIWPSTISFSPSCQKGIFQLFHNFIKEMFFISKPCAVTVEQPPSQSKDNWIYGSTEPTFPVIPKKGTTYSASICEELQERTWSCQKPPQERNDPSQASHT